MPSRYVVMSDETQSYEYKKIDETIIANIRKPLKKRIELKERFEKLKEVCADHICGPAVMIQHYDTNVEDGLDIEAGYPVTQAIETKEIKTRTLEALSALTVIYRGPYEELGDTFKKLHEYRSTRGLPTGLSPREVYLKGPFMDDPEDNVTELQATLHDWDVRFCGSLEEFLDNEPITEVLEGFEKITPFTSAEERAKWMIQAIEKLDRLANEEQKFEVISRCAHVRPAADVEHWKEVFERNHDIDEFLSEYKNSLPFLEKPYREGNILYTSKPPADREAYDKATTIQEKIKAACFCPIIHAALNKMSKTFCYCGAGWARQLYEGMFNEPVKVDVVKTVVAGDKLCKFAVHLPDHVIKTY